MKKLVAGSFTLVFLMSVLHLHGAVITGTSEPFVFGSPPPPVPLSYLAFIIPAALILLYTAWRFFRLKNKATV